MSTQSPALPSGLSAGSCVSASLLAELKRVCSAIGVYITAYMDAQAAAALYENLSKLSDAELARRGLSRADLRAQVHERLTTHS